MKKYRKLEIGETTKPGDEMMGVHGWLTLSGEQKVRFLDDEFRTPIPHEGHVQFLMHVSILVPVVVNCGDKTQEEVEDEAGRLAVEKILEDPTQYVHLENIDWEGSKVDDVQPEWRMLEAGETIEGGDQVKLPFETWEEVQNSIGMKIKPHNAGMVRRRIN